MRPSHGTTKEHLAQPRLVSETRPLGNVSTEASRYLELGVRRLEEGLRDGVTASLLLKVLDSSPTALERARAHSNLAVVHLGLGLSQNACFYRSAVHHAWRAIRADASVLTPYVSLLEGALRTGDVSLVEKVWAFWAQTKPASQPVIASLLEEDFELEFSRAFLAAMGGGASVRDVVKALSGAPE